MKKLLYILLFAPLVLFGQEQDPCFSVNDLFSQMIEENPSIEINLDSGWNMIGYPCTQEIIVSDAFSSIVEDISMVKDNNGNVYMPEFGFNGIGFLEGGQGYQIKMDEFVTAFTFCQSIELPFIEGCKDCEASNFNQLANIDNGSCNYDSDGDGIDDTEEIAGCQDEIACNYDVLSTDNVGCTYSEEHHDCDGNLLIYIGLEEHGGIVFYYDSIGHYGLVAAMEDVDINGFEWGCYGIDVNGGSSQIIGAGYQNTLDIVAGCSETPIAASEALAYESEDYSDWYLPSKQELELMYNTIGQGADNAGGFVNTYYWSSSEYNNNFAYFVHLGSNGQSSMDNKQNNYRVRAIRSFGYTFGCMNETACNFNPEANKVDGSCEFASDNYNCSDVCLNDEDSDGICDELEVIGCQDSSACNYNVSATDAGECTYNDEDSDGICDELEVIGCQDSSACNYNVSATDAGECTYAEEFFNCEGNYLLTSCPYPNFLEYNESAINIDASLCITLIIEGCVDSSAGNYNQEANFDDGSCEYIYGCTLDVFPNYNSEATIDDFSCDMSSADVFGCTNPIYLEYDPIVNQDNGTCSILVLYGCIEPTAFNYNAEAGANTDDGTCIAVVEGCLDESAFNYNSDANTDDGSCVAVVNGCTDETAFNYNAGANTDDGSCEAIVLGCMDEIAFNYNADANTDDGTCIAVVEGCLDESAFNYNDLANTEDNSCIDVVEGCTDNLSCNYNPEANTGDGSCVYAQSGYDCEGNFTPEVGYMIEGGIVFYIDETGQHGLVAAMEDLDGTYEWGCMGADVEGADGQAIGTGYQNTLDIVSGCSETPIAASLALAYESEGYTDWYLPSKDELIEMYNTIGNGGPEGNIGGFSNNFYWSSSENNYSGAWIVPFNNGYTNYVGYKNETHRVRVIRAF